MMGSGTLPIRKIEFRFLEDRKPISESVIYEFAKAISVEFPASYVSLVAEMGGCLLDDQNTLMACTVGWDGSDSGDAVDLFLHCDKKAGGSIHGPYDIVTDEVSGLVPIARGTASNFFCFDYRKTRKDPPVVYYERDNMYADPGEEDPNGNDFVERSIHFCAASFEEFLDKLESSES